MSFKPYNDRMFIDSSKMLTIELFFQYLLKQPDSVQPNTQVLLHLNSRKEKQNEE